MKYFDLHCDTLYEVYHKKEDITSGSLMISLSKCKFDEYKQVLAIYSNNSKSDDENFDDFIKIHTHFKKKHASLPDNFSYILAVEGAKLLAGDITRLTDLHDIGVKILTLVWKDTCCIGGAHNTYEGFTDFGFEVLEKCFSLGIIPDLSHASDKMFWQTAELSHKYKKPFIASHSNSRAITDCARNLTDDMFREIARSGGIVGINLYPPFLSKSGKADITDIIAHIKHFLSLGGESSLALGCDFDGVDALPAEISGARDVPKIYDALIKSGISSKTADKIFYENANNFFINNNINFI